MAESGGKGGNAASRVRAAEVRKARAAEQLRANLQKRKQQARARRAGEPDQRQGLDGAVDGKSD